MTISFRFILFSIILIIFTIYVGIPSYIHAISSEEAEYLTVYCSKVKFRKRGKKNISVIRHVVKTNMTNCANIGGDVILEDSDEFAEAVIEWKPNPKEKSPIIQTENGEVYEKGRRYQDAAIWYRKAAEQDYSKAQILLGNLYEKGLGVEKNFDEALYWYRRASGLSDAIKLENDSARNTQVISGNTDLLPPLPTNIKLNNSGRYYALIIGNQDYTEWPKLDTPSNDAYKTAEILKNKYGFQTKVLIDATRSEIFKALEAYKHQLNENDNLLVYYAGHGDLEKQLDHTYWVPIDGEVKSKAYWISTFDITSQVDLIPAKHILIISDSCYSGGLTISAIARRLPGMNEEAVREWINGVSKKSSRTVLTSGGKTPVLDGGGSGHSVFAKAFLNALETNDGVIEGAALYSQIRGRVVSSAKEYNFEQVPSYAPLKFSNHEGGEFIFIPK